MNERHFLLSEWSKCSPVIDIRHDLTAVRCFGLSEHTRVSIRDFSGLSELEDYYIEKYDKWAFSRAYYKKCVDCTARQWEQCMGSCMAYRSEELFASEEQADGAEKLLNYRSEQERLQERFLKCYMKNKVFRGVADAVQDELTLQKFIEELEKKAYDMAEIKPIYEKMVTYRAAMKEARTERRKNERKDKTESVSNGKGK